MQGLPTNLIQVLSEVVVGQEVAVWAAVEGGEQQEQVVICVRRHREHTDPPATF